MANPLDLERELLPFASSEERQLLRGRALSADNEQSLLAELRDALKRWRDSLKPTREQLLQVTHEENRIHARLNGGNQQFWDGLDADWRRKQNPTAEDVVKARNPKPQEPQEPSQTSIPDHPEIPTSGFGDPRPPQAPNAFDVIDAIRNSEIAKFWTPRPDQQEAQEPARSARSHLTPKDLARIDALGETEGFVVQGSAAPPESDSDEPPYDTIRLSAQPDPASAPLPEPHGFARVPKVLQGGLFALFFALVVLALQSFDVVTVNWGHIYMFAATLVGILIICLEIIPGKPTKHKVRWAIVLVLVMLALDFWMAWKAQAIGPPKPSATIKAPASSATPPNGERISTNVDPSYLVGLYQKHNSAQADQVVRTYIGEPLKASGVVDDVSRNGDDVSVLLMVKRIDGWTLYAISARFDEQMWKDRAVVLSKGEKVTVSGKIRGASETSVFLEHCQIIE